MNIYRLINHLDSIDWWLIQSIYRFDHINKSPSDSADPYSKQAFLQEIDTMKDMGWHDNLVNILGCVTVDEPYCLVMEYCSDGNLLEFLRSRTKYMMKVGIIDWLIWLMNWLIWLVYYEWLIWLMNQFINHSYQVIGMIDWSRDWLMNWLIIWLINRLIWLIDRWIFWLIDRIDRSIIPVGRKRNQILGTNGNHWIWQIHDPNKEASSLIRPTSQLCHGLFL